MLRELVGICAGIVVLVGVEPGTVSAAVVEFQVNDTEGELLPCRIHLKTADGTSLFDKALLEVIKSVRRDDGKSGAPPLFRQDRISDHFVCAGEATLELPPGEYSYEIERGPEYAPVTGKITVGKDGDQQITAKLSRITNLRKEGWYSGDLHVHRQLSDIELLMLAEDLDVAPVLTWWNDRNYWENRDVPEETVVRFGDRFYEVMGGEDEREGGALLFFNLDQPMPITGSSREYPSPMKFVAMAREHDGVWIDIEKPFWWDVPVWIAGGVGQSIGLANNHMNRAGMLPNEAWGRARDTKRLPNPRGNGFWTQEIYYNILNSGIRIPPSAGSASGVLPNPVGYNRVYVQLGDKLDYSSWWEGLREGRVFVTNGPLLRVTANGELPGHVFSADDKAGIDIDLKALLDSNDPIKDVEIVVNGKVTRSVPFDEVKKTGGLGKIHFDKSGWFLVRAITDKTNTFRFASTGPYYVEVGDSKRRVSRESAQFFVDWVKQRMNRVKLKLADEEQIAGVLKYQQQALEFWQKVLAKANAD